MRQPLRSALLIFVLSPGLATLLHAGVITFDFEDSLQFAGANPGSTPFTYTINGLTATFSSSNDPVGFMVIDTGANLTVNFLAEFTAPPTTLTIAFDAPQASISMDFFTSDTGQLNLSAFNGGTPVGIPSAAMTAGTLSFAGGTFDSVKLDSTLSFGIDNVTVTSPVGGPVGGGPVSNPEPGSFLLCGGALTALSFLRRRRVS